MMTRTIMRMIKASCVLLEPSGMYPRSRTESSPLDSNKALITHNSFNKKNPTHKIVTLIHNWSS